MNKKGYIILGGIILFIALLFMLDRIDNDAIRFSREYKGVPKENVFVYKNIDEIIKIMEHGTGIVYLGFPDCPWCRAYVKYLNEVAIEEGIEKIYYCNILEDRKNNTKEYQKIVELLGDNLQYDEEGNLRVYVPNVSFHIKGEVIGNDYETSYDTKGYKDPKDYWTNDRVDDLKKRLTEYMEDVYVALNSCTDCNK